MMTLTDLTVIVIMSTKTISVSALLRVKQSQSMRTEYALRGHGRA
jgi:hypothetical protein